MKPFLPLFLMMFGISQSLWAGNQVVVLQYHHFSNTTPATTSVTLDQFEQQLSYLDQQGVAVVSFEEAVKNLQAGRELPDKCIAITIDDAYSSIYHEAFPRFKKRQWPFTVFVASDPVDKGHSAYMTWSQMREMSGHGATFASHSHSHPYFIKEWQRRSITDWRDWAKKEIVLSRERIKSELGSDSRLFAYPYGEYNLELKQIVAELGLIGVGQHSGVIWPGSDFQALPRFPVSGEYAEIKEFSIKVKALPLPVLAIDPRETVLSANDDKPILRLKLSAGNYQVDLLSCYASQQGQMQVSWVDRSNLVMEIIPRQVIPFGRSKYNCTAPQLGSNRFFWFSRQWLRLQ